MLIFIWRRIPFWLSVYFVFGKRDIFKVLRYINFICPAPYVFVTCPLLYKNHRWISRTQWRSLTYKAAVACWSAEDVFLSATEDWEGSGEEIVLPFLYYQVNHMRPIVQMRQDIMTGVNTWLSYSLKGSSSSLSSSSLTFFWRGVLAPSSSSPLGLMSGGAEELRSRRSLFFGPDWVGDDGVVVSSSP